MDSSAHDDPVETPMAEMMSDRIEVTGDTHEEETSVDGSPASMADVQEDAPVEELPMAQPGWYYCTIPNPGIHPQLGQLLEGENDFTGISHPEALRAITALIAGGGWSAA